MSRYYALPPLPPTSLAFSGPSPSLDTVASDRDPSIAALFCKVLAWHLLARWTVCPCFHFLLLEGIFCSQIDAKSANQPNRRLVFMNIYVYFNIYVYSCMFTSIYAHLCIFMSISAYFCIFMYSYLYLCTFIYIYVDFMHIH